MNGMFFGIVDQDNNFIVFGQNCSGEYTVFTKVPASSASFFNCEFDANNVRDKCGEAYPESVFYIKRFEF